MAIVSRFALLLALLHFVHSQQVLTNPGNTAPPFFAGDTTGQVWTWGHNRRGQLGLGDGLYGGDPNYPNDIPGCIESPDQKCAPEFVRRPQPMRMPPIYTGRIEYISAGAYHTVAVTDAGVLVAWGWNGLGQLGTDSNVPTYGLPSHPAEWTQRNLPTAVRFVDGIKFKRAAAGMFHSLALDEAGKVYSWGMNTNGQLCLGHLRNQNFPQSINMPPIIGTNPSAGRWSQVCAGQEHSVMLSEYGHVYTCGSNSVQQLGVPRTGDYEQRSMLAIRTCQRDATGACLPNSITNIVKISCGQYHTLALSSSGQLWSWGDNRFGQIGNGGTAVTRFAVLESPFAVNFFDKPLFADLSIDPELPNTNIKILDMAAGAFHNIVFAVRPTTADFTPNATLRIDSNHFRDTRLVLNVNSAQEFTTAIPHLFYVGMPVRFAPRSDGGGALPDLIVAGELYWVNSVVSSVTFTARNKLNQLVGGIFGELHAVPDVPVSALVSPTFPTMICNNATSLTMRNPCALLEGCEEVCYARFRKMFLMSWGSNQFGQLGLTCDIDTPDPNCLAFIRPQYITQVDALDIVNIAAGNFHNILTVLSKRTSKECLAPRHPDLWKTGLVLNPNLWYCEGRVLYAFGQNVDGQLGVGDVFKTPGVYIVPGSVGRNFSRVSLGFRHSVAISGACPNTSMDSCGVCFGNHVACVGCDGVPNSGKVLDACGKCGGTNSTCKGCDGVPLSGKKVDLCNGDA
jgi:alpha-tubulin suppressor-like RCC1 family protein